MSFPPFALPSVIMSRKRSPPRFLELKNHPDADVREAVAFGLVLCETPQSLQVLLELMEDNDTEVRSWATCAVGGFEDNSPATLNALIRRTEDWDSEVRGEALFGLADHKHPQASALIRRELEENGPDKLSLRAAGWLADPSLIEVLEKLRPACGEEEKLLSELDWAVQECSL